jgi:hypothetical protein
MVPVLAIPDSASMSNVTLQNFMPAMPAMPAGLCPADPAAYANYFSMTTKRMMGMGNQDLAIFPPNHPRQPNPREVAEFAYAYHHQMNQANPNADGDKSSL